MAPGVMVGCRRAPEVCKSNIDPISRGLTDGWICSERTDPPSQNECQVTGSRQRSEPGIVGSEFTLCCKPSPNCKPILETYTMESNDIDTLATG
ncbi:hypothetical protein GCG54_00014029 [Colletotrichum gloeosporioides]|uniref:Uncharacterized protein n=1 Tax=Colletotrichum gloeosporioides TaxID=474922 RepID=A0A8H4CFG9_COLGL|nr:uncharacterized protein GCG54_00014029 [Colletotrichum gloeosporioides]KAF3802792.1 hypothetical protein GCG54_00014029 [Colletotrichum gloeosporioides]